MRPVPPAWPASLPPPRDPAGPYRICLVCLGNICRSPMAEAVLAARLASRGVAGAVRLDSAGTGDWHVGGGMDSRARAELAARGYTGESHRARQFRPSWLAERDLILAMDRHNLADLQAMSADRRTAGERIRLFLSFDRGSGQDAEVPDPYYGGGASFGEVLDLIETAAGRLAAELATALAADSGTRPGADG